jgi:hypothetical protein
MNINIIRSIKYSNKECQELCIFTSALYSLLKEEGQDEGVMK